MTSHKLNKPMFHNFVHIEDAKLNTPYKITLNPPLNLVGAFNTVDEAKSFFGKQLQSFYCNYKYCIELDSKGRFHIHGWITITNILDFYIKELRKLKQWQGTISNNMTDFKTKSPYKTWDEYCMKQQKIIGIGWICSYSNMIYQLKDVPVPKAQLVAPVRKAYKAEDCISMAQLIKDNKTPSNSPTGFTIELE